MHAIKLATINTARYFGLSDLGAIAPGRIANLAVLDDLEQCHVTRTYHEGELAALDGVALDRGLNKPRRQILRSSVNVQWLEQEQFAIKAPIVTANATCT